MDKSRDNSCKQTVLIMSNFRAQYSGNFINSLLALAEKEKISITFFSYFLFAMRVRNAVD
jgi:hypothetical protein